MYLLFDLSLPLKDPVAVFGLVLAVIFFMPIVLRKIRIPGIVGLILAGVAIGPKGFGVLELDTAIKLLGTVGLLYIMFLAGLEIDFRDFLKNRNKSLVFGFLTFSIPLSIGTVTTLYVLNFPFNSALLLASMYATHTLISYPIVSRFGITKNEAVTITVGGTIVTDTAALLLLSFITLTAKGAGWQDVAIKLTLSFIAFLVVVFGVLPPLARWFFRKVESEGASQFIFSLLFVFLCAFIAELAGIEAIIGAFLAGLVLNRLVPHSSVLMNRINFVGNALFIPIFLISVGMRVNLGVLFADINSWKVAGTIIVVAYCTKWIAAYITQQIYGYSVLERRIIFGLGSSHAAATLAIILIGFDLKLFDMAVLNGTILMILVTCLVSTFITEAAAKKIAAQDLIKINTDTEGGDDRILVPIANPASFEQLIDLAILIRDPKSKEPIFPLSVVNDDAESRRRVLLNDRIFERAIAHATAAEVPVDLISRVDLNVAGGIVRAVKDLAISDIVIGWNGKSSAIESFFGSIMAQILENTAQNVLVSKFLQPVNTFQNIYILVPENAELEKGFGHWLTLINRLSQQLNAALRFFIVGESCDKIEKIWKADKKHSKASFNFWRDYEELEFWSAHFKENDLLVVISAREQTLSYTKTLERLPRILSDVFANVSFVILFPEQTASIWSGTEGGVSEQFVG